ncbi:YfiR family protein [Microbulbifer sediminum]|uniref:YfiR family protein n=1 Tax=Microbulbifer sediminum TaxID=2904250 RepID=UPI001F3DE8E3|nr:YfiR family protein [Microbulbifer sediminum]
MKRDPHLSYRRLAVQLLGHLLLLLLLLVILSAGAAAAPSRLSDSEAGRRLMINYIIHFAHHLQWPIEVFTGTGAPFRICLLGQQELRAPLAEQLKYHRVDGRPVEVTELPPDEKLQARRCQILVLGRVSPDYWRELVLALEFFPVLTVSDTEGFIAAGGMIGFVRRGPQVAVRLNKTVFDRSDLRIGSSLFRLTSGAD